MSKNLVIVESPAKAKTIEGYLGKDYTVKSCFGHVRDLKKGDKAIDVANGFAPTYEVTEDKKDVVRDLRKFAKESDTVWLATDDDREGEAISWHLLESLNLDEATTPRIVFREITKTAILKAIENPRRLNLDLVNAQQARRILDRLVGFELSPILWKKIKTGLSAGRVQSVAVRLVVEREREIEGFDATSFFRVTGVFATSQGKNFKAEWDKKFNTEAEAMALLEALKGSGFAVESIEKKPLRRTPAAPFTTSTLQQEASRKLGFSVSQTMTLAQRLYEAGKISYMRTDSLNLSDDAIKYAKDAITAAYGAQYSETRKFKTKSESAQEAHEAIRPTDFTTTKAGNERNEERLYELIWKRAIASQMKDAELEKTTAKIEALAANKAALNNGRFVASGEVVKFDGFMKVYVEDTDIELTEDEDSAMLPALSEREAISKGTILAKQRYTRPAPRYTEASLVKKLEENGIGRPSTYAPTISTIIKREYVEKESREGKKRASIEFRLDEANEISQLTEYENTGAEKSKLFPTDIGTVVNDFLVQHFPNVVDYSFTANVEKEFDQIAKGNAAWPTMIGNFYKDFHTTVEETANIERASIKTGKDLGLHPETGQKVAVRLGKFGPVAQLGDSENGEKPAYASLLKDQRMETITLEEVLELFKLPRLVGEGPLGAISAALGRFGPYLKYNSKFYSLPKDADPISVDLIRSLEIIEAKDIAESNKLIKAFVENADSKVLNGRFGPYVVHDGRNLKIAKGTEPMELSYETVLQMAAEQPVKKTGRGATKPAAKKAAEPKEAKPKEAKPKVTKATATKAKAKSKPKAAAKPAAKAKAAPKKA